MVVEVYMSQLTRDDIKSLCDAAENAWEKAGKRAKEVKFTWRGKKWVSTMSNFRLMVEPASGGEPKVCRWF